MYHAQLASMKPGAELTEAQLDTADEYVNEYPGMPHVMTQTTTLADLEKGDGADAKKAKKETKEQQKKQADAAKAASKAAKVQAKTEKKNEKMEKAAGKMI